MFGRNRRYSETPKHWTFWDHNFTVIQRLSTLRGKIVLLWPVGTTELVLLREVKYTVYFNQKSPLREVPS